MLRIARNREKNNELGLGPEFQPRFPFSKLVSDKLNREIAFENGYRESRFRRISRLRRKAWQFLETIVCEKLGRPLPRGRATVGVGCLGEAERERPDCFPIQAIRSTHVEFLFGATVVRRKQPL